MSLKPMKRVARMRFAPALCLAVMICGCATAPPDAFYTLAPLAVAQQGDATTADESLAVGVGPISLPEYLDRSQIVGRKDTSALTVDEVHLWGGSLHDDFPRVLGENLAQLLGTNRILVNTSEVRYPVDVRVAADVLRFEVENDGEAVLKVRWMLIGPDSDRVLMVRESSFRAKSQSADPAAMVGAMSRALEDFSEELSKAIRDLLPLSASHARGDGK